MPVLSVQDLFAHMNSVTVRMPMKSLAENSFKHLFCFFINLYAKINRLRYWGVKVITYAESKISRNFKQKR